MARWISIGMKPDWSDFAIFEKDLRDTSRWRVSTKTSITNVYVLADERVIVECHAQDRTEFERWMASVGFQPESITEISHVAKTGDVWNLRKP